MAENPATSAQIREACPGASAEFVLDHLEAGATIADVQASFIAWQAAQIRTRDEQLKENKPVRTGGHVKPVGSGRRAGARSNTDDAESGPTGDPVADFNAAVDHEMEMQGKRNQTVDRKRAIAAVSKRDPELLKSYTMHNNPQRNRLVDDYFQDRA